MLMRYDDAAAVRLFLYLPYYCNLTHWGSSVGYLKGPGGIASAAIATRNAVPYLLQI